MKRGAHAKRPAGIALLMTLVIVLLMTAYITEFFFSSGLEMRAIQTFKESSEARNLAKLAFKAVQISMFLDEVEMMEGYRELEKTLSAGVALPWRNGLLLELELTPLDSLYNLNELYNIREDGDIERARWALFIKTLEDMPIPPAEEGAEAMPLDISDSADIYAALFDWIDKNEMDYTGYTGSSGAEAGSYLSHDPEFRVKNGKMDRLSEIRMVRGLIKSGIPWSSWESNFTVLPKSKKAELYPEKLNVNVATSDEIIKFLKRRGLEAHQLESSNMQAVQLAVAGYADNADEIATLLAPKGGQRLRFDKKSLENELKKIQGIKAGKWYELFDFSYQYYRVKIVTGVNELEAELEAVVEIRRGKAAKSNMVDVIQYTLN